MFKRARRVRKHGNVRYIPELGWLYILKDREGYVAGPPIDTRIEILYRDDKIVGVKVYLTPEQVGNPR